VLTMMVIMLMMVSLPSAMMIIITIAEGTFTRNGLNCRPNEGRFDGLGFVRSRGAARRRDPPGMFFVEFVVQLVNLRFGLL